MLPTEGEGVAVGVCCFATQRERSFARNRAEARRERDHRRRVGVRAAATARGVVDVEALVQVRACDRVEVGVALVERFARSAARPSAHDGCAGAGLHGGRVVAGLDTWIQREGVLSAQAVEDHVGRVGRALLRIDSEEVAVVRPVDEDRFARTTGKEAGGVSRPGWALYAASRGGKGSVARSAEDQAEVVVVRPDAADEPGLVGRGIDEVVDLSRARVEVPR